MTVDVSQFHQVFFEESLEHLANMESGLLQLESAGNDPELINVIFRGAHSIKGGSGTFGFQDVAGFTHVMETLLDKVRSGTTGITPEIIAILLESVDALRDMINALQAGNGIDLSRSAGLQKQLTNLLEGGVSRSESSAKHSAIDETKAAGNEKVWHIQFRPHRHLFQTGNDPSRILRELHALGRLVTNSDLSSLPKLDEMNPEECYLAWDLVLHTLAGRAEIDEIFAWVDGDCDLIIDEITALVEHHSTQATPTPAKSSHTENEKHANVEKGAPSPGERRPGAERRHNEGESIRVSIEKIDAIINLVGELVITQSMLSQVGSAVGELSGSSLENLRDGLAQLERNTRELQESVMRIRMLPISFAFSRFPRLVHDLSIKLGKKVELKLSGEQTELDKTVMEKIGDPLVHLVRNAIDHGIEMPEERIKNGKDETGQIHLDAYHQGGNIVIEIGDDGAGLNAERIAKKARERGLISEDAELDNQRIIELVFEPGFSTAEIVSDVSGRGVGMDVVRRNIRDLGGNVEVTSTPGQGSRFIIRLPLTLAILDGQLVRVGEQIYITPLVSIVESLQLRAESINSVAGRGKVYRLREEYIPIMDLRKVFAVDKINAALNNTLLVVVEAEGKKMGLIVDDLLGQQQVVIKSLESNYRPVPGISGATILGDGTVALILDAGQLISMACGNKVYVDAGNDGLTVAA